MKDLIGLIACITGLKRQVLKILKPPADLHSVVIEFGITVQLAGEFRKLGE